MNVATRRPLSAADLNFDPSAAQSLATQLNCDGVHISAADQSRKGKSLSPMARSARGTPI